MYIIIANITQLIIYYNGQAYETDHYPVLYKWYMSNVVTLKTTADENCLYHAISTSISGNENLWKDIKLGMIFMFFEYEDYFRKLANAMGLEASFELLIESSATIAVFGRSFNLLSLSLLFLRPIYIFETSNLSFISDVPCLNTVPIYLSLNNAHFTSIVPYQNSYFIPFPNASHLKHVKVSLDNLNFY
ncbi:unnamed protein product [Brachionus calyciflorus]|uniref:OTU domain-containing protein n=1 Tax=Brachionus calyciflorus TaxID=104777 RepID=A0A814JL13_9BILA|nr:unnamed protein product [Brachionus calyciflorus]